MGRALAWADELHASQRRKGSDIPYLSHLLAVTALVLEAGGGEDEAIAALLHDAAEDQGGRETLARIRQRFGERVACIVEAASDSLTGPGEAKAPWRARKQAHLDHLAHEDDDGVLLVLLADKVANAASILRDLRNPAVGEAVWDRFARGRDGTLWYYRALADRFGERRPTWPLTAELERLLGDLAAA
jgi:(p)ppGpp synthase/HD superfamily hydrolase